MKQIIETKANLTRWTVAEQKYPKMTILTAGELCDLLKNAHILPATTIAEIADGSESPELFKREGNDIRPKPYAIPLRDGTWKRKSNGKSAWYRWIEFLERFDSLTETLEMLGIYVDENAFTKTLEETLASVIEKRGEKYGGAEGEAFEIALRLTLTPNTKRKTEKAKPGCADISKTWSEEQKATLEWLGLI